MLVADARVALGEWLPDLPELGNLGLTEARNCIPVDDYYTDFQTLAASGSTLAATCNGAFAAIDSNGDPEIYAGTETALYERVGSAWTNRAAATLGATEYWQFAQFENLVIATDYSNDVLYKTIGAASNFATHGSAPNARQVGVINRFLVLGDLDQGAGAVPYATQWSAIDDPLDFPTPGTSTARAEQAGEQFLQAEHGAVTAIAGGQFWGLVFQKRAITRYTYVGGDIVFQIDNFERSRGCWCPKSHIQVGNLSYFFAHDGVYVTDGQSVRGIGDGKVDRWLTNRLSQGDLERVTAGVDWDSKCIYWLFPTISTVPDTVLIYSIAKNRFAYANQSAQLVFPSFSESIDMDSLDSLYPTLEDIGVSLDSSSWRGGIPTIMGVSTGRQLGVFTGDSGVAVFETGERDENPFGRVFIRGVRPLVTGSPSAVTVAIATRDTQDNAGRVFGSAQTRTTRTGVCDFRTQGRFVSSRLTVTGGFDRAIGLEFDAEAGHQV
jgi:hypothetical protein